MEAFELARLENAVTRRVAEPRRREEPAARLTMPSALLSLQRLAGNASVSALLTDDSDEPSPIREVVGSGGGSPLDAGTRSFMETRLGADFSDVRIHTGARADDSARSINAQAYTVGSQVVFRSGAFQPDSPAGQHVLAHELAHVVQQRSGPVSGVPAPGGISVSQPGDPFEQAADRAAASALAGDGVIAQRAGPEDEEEYAQTLTAQRVAAAPEEEEQLGG
jgi:hypothetical protein